MPKTIFGKPVDEAKWSEAKALAEKEGHGKDYAYIMGIYKKMVGLKKSLVLLKGRKAVPDGTIKDVKGTPYKRMKQGDKWIHIKVNKQGQITDLKGNVIGQVPGTSSNVQVTTPVNDTQVKRGRGRPKGSTNKKKTEDTTSTNIATPKVSIKKEKVEKKIKKDKYEIGARVMRKNASGNYYWSVKQADGTWKYDGMASEQDIKLLEIKSKKEKKIQRARELDALVKQNIVPAKTSEGWNPDGTPKPETIEKMNIREKLYWTQATPKAQALARQCGILCLDKESEDYVESKLEDVFKTATVSDKKEMDAIRAHIPLDADAKFADDPVFMEDTLKKLKEYRQELIDNETFITDKIQDRMRHEELVDATNARGSGTIARTIGYSEAKEEYTKLLSAVEEWIKDIEDSDSDKIILEDMQKLDVNLSALKEYRDMSMIALHAEFSDELLNHMNLVKEWRRTADDSSKSNAEVEQAIDDLKNSFIGKIFSELFSDSVSDTDLTYLLTRGSSYNMFMPEHFEQLLFTVMNPNFNINNSKNIFDMSRFMSVSKGYSDTIELNTTPEKFFKVADKLRAEHKNLSNLLSKLTINPIEIKMPEPVYSKKPEYYIDKVLGFDLYDYANASTTFNPDSNWIRPSVDTELSEVRDAMKFLTKTPKLAGHRNLFIRMSDGISSLLEVSEKIQGGVATKARNLGDLVDLAFKNKAEKLSKGSQAVVRVPDINVLLDSLNLEKIYNYSGGRGFKRLVSPAYFNAENVSYRDKGNKAKYRSQARKTYNSDESNLGFLNYASVKVDNMRGGTKRKGTQFFQEVNGENIALKNAIRTKWLRKTLISSAASYTHNGNINHAKASLAVAIGLNWQLRKLVKKKKLIPEWKWYEGTKPYDLENKFPVTTAEPLIENPTVARRYGGWGRGSGVISSQYKTNRDREYAFTEAHYKEMLENAKRETLASELGLLDPTGNVTSPKIVLKTSKESAVDWQKKIEADWTHSGNYSAGSFKVHHVFDIMYHEYFDKYKAAEQKRGNVQYMYHGTDFERGASIMKGGYKIGLPIKTGNMLGTNSNKTEGIYLAKSSSKSAQYVARSYGRDGTGVMFMNRVALGKMNAGPDWSSAKHDPSYDTIYAKAGSGLQHDEWMTRGSDAVIPIQWIDIGAV